MRTLNVAMMVVGIVVLLAVSALTVITAVYPGVLVAIGDFISGPMGYVVEGLAGRALALLLGLLILLMLIYLIFGNIQSARRQRTVVLENPNGEVLVSLPAIEDFSRILKGKIDGLRDIKGKVVFSRRGLKVSARITTYSDFNIAEVAQNVQAAVRDYVKKTLNIEQEINPTVIVTKVVNRERPAGSSGIKTTVLNHSEEENNDGTTEIHLKK